MAGTKGHVIYSYFRHLGARPHKAISLSSNLSLGSQISLACGNAFHGEFAEASCIAARLIGRRERLECIFRAREHQVLVRGSGRSAAIFEAGQVIRLVLSPSIYRTEPSPDVLNEAAYWCGMHRPSWRFSNACLSAEGNCFSYSLRISF